MDVTKEVNELSNRMVAHDHSSLKKALINLVKKLGGTYRKERPIEFEVGSVWKPSNWDNKMMIINDYNKGRVQYLSVRVGKCASTGTVVKAFSSINSMWEWYSDRNKMELIQPACYDYED